MRVGVDVGGTNTDAVVMEDRRVLGTVKTPTTPDVTTGIVSALRSLIDDGVLVPSQVSGIMIGTTHFTNAVVEAKHLAATAAVRIGLPATTAVLPLVDWPDRLRRAIGNHVYLCHGGHEFDGRPSGPLNYEELKRVAADAASKGIRSMAITAVFSPVNGEVEVEAAAVIRSEVPDMVVSLSQKIGRIGLLERENATIINACLRPLAGRIVDAFQVAISKLAIDAPLYISQNDGTLMDAEFAKHYPVATFASGPTNSMRGAAFLSELTDAAVVDVGGTTADIGMLVNGFPREASVTVHIGGVRTNFRMPDVLSLGIGGGSVVRGGTDDLTIGPDSVGYELSSRALVFGGDTLTATDVAVAAGMVDIGDASLVKSLDRDYVRAAVDSIQRAVSDGVDRMKTSAEPVPVIVVGGGGVLVTDEIAGTSGVVRPEHFSVANAIGAAIAQVGGETDRIFSLSDIRHEEAVEQAKAQARERAIDAGADPSSVRIVEVEEVPLAYLPSNAVRVRVKAVGDLRV
ncbi:MAG: hydantoinase/oxoprolinase family protein [Acidobacteria bacterium]|nr:hydantoinase/oxoprolinase family protein [Acidobacteriota bacterium]MCH8985737.1 hydantoinase/oxoprolinase family protein [Acidobacteriota bacterium]